MAQSVPVLPSLGRSRGDKADAASIERLKSRQKDREVEDAKAEVRALEDKLAGLEAAAQLGKGAGAGSIEEVKAKAKCRKLEADLAETREKVSSQ